MTDKSSHTFFLQRAIDLSRSGSIAGHGGPFGALVVKNGLIVGQGFNQVTLTNDPSAHAEIVAIRDACKTLGTFQLTGCEIYSSCEPCPMCLGAIYWARPDKVYFASTRQDAATAGFDDAMIYEEIKLSGENRKIPMIYIPMKPAKDVFKQWALNPENIRY